MPVAAAVNGGRREEKNCDTIQKEEISLFILLSLLLLLSFYCYYRHDVVHIVVVHVIIVRATIGTIHLVNVINP